MRLLTTSSSPWLLAFALLLPLSCTSLPDPTEELQGELTELRLQLKALEEERDKLFAENQAIRLREQELADKYELLKAEQAMARATDIEKHLAIADRDQLAADLKTVAMNETNLPFSSSNSPSNPVPVVLTTLHNRAIPGTGLFSELRAKELCIRPQQALASGNQAWLELRWRGGAGRVLLVLRQKEIESQSITTATEAWIDGPGGSQTDVIKIQGLETVTGGDLSGTYWICELSEGEIVAILSSSMTQGAVLRSNIPALGAITLGKDWAAAMGEIVMARVDLARK